MLAVKIKELFTVSGIVLCLIIASHSFAQSWSGQLSYVDDVADGFISDAANATHGWRKESRLTWEISHDTANSPGGGYDWKYSYTIDTDQWVPVRLMVETGSGFTIDHIDFDSVEVYIDEALTTYDAAANATIGWHQPTTGPNTPLRDMPEERYGIFFAEILPEGPDTEKTSITFWSKMEPMWGDLYANCGGHGNRGWNQGFMDQNPTDDPSDGSVDFHVLTPIPEPGVALFVAVASLILVVRRRIKRHVTAA